MNNNEILKKHIEKTTGNIDGAFRILNAELKKNNLPEIAPNSYSRYFLKKNPSKPSSALVYMMIKCLQSK